MGVSSEVYIHIAVAMDCVHGAIIYGTSFDTSGVHSSLMLGKDLSHLCPHIWTCVLRRLGFLSS